MSDAVGFGSMKLEVRTSKNGTSYVSMYCDKCGERVCQYTTTDLDELRGEYSAHLSLECTKRITPVKKVVSVTLLDEYGQAIAAQQLTVDSEQPKGQSYKTELWGRTANGSAVIIPVTFMITMK